MPGFVPWRRKFPDIAVKFSDLLNISLLSSLGNCARKHCSPAVTCRVGGVRSREIAKFPAKFPVSRQFAQRRVRSALRRQPKGHTHRLQPSFPEQARKGRQLEPLRAPSFVSRLPLGVSSGRTAESLQPNSRKLPFRVALGDVRINALLGRRGSALPSQVSTGSM